MKNYGITNQAVAGSEIDYHLENLKINGFSVAENIIDKTLCDEFSSLLEKVYSEQEKEFGKENLQKINETDIARMPFLNDGKFAELFMNDFIIELAERVIGKHFQLHLQNGIINRPAKEHHQSSWHRDLPYQDWVITKPLGFNAFHCLTDFTNDNGATYVLPYSHRLDYFPSEKFVAENEVQITAPKGSVIFFDSMIYHRAGYNSTSATRIGVNNMFVVPIIKQQMDLSSIAEGLDFNENIKNILGKQFRLESSVKDYRSAKLNKKK